MEELFTLRAGRWAIVVSKVEPGTLEHQQGARHAVTIYCDDKLLVAFAYTATRRGEGACVEDMIDEGPDLVDFVLSERDLQSLELLLPRAHQLIRDLGKSARGVGNSSSEVRWNDRDRREPNSRTDESTTTP
ncbi:MAG: hypothetical protein JOZ17_17975 [Acetobacteraceae bacterium]|nr:hypothetical protein [Acetobacteraceae bacterium]